MKKILSIFLCFVIILSVFLESSVTIFAEGDSDEYGDISVREDYEYYKNDFVTETGSGLVEASSLGSSVNAGALEVKPNEVNVWKTSDSVEVPGQLVVTFGFMLPELIKEGESLKLFYDSNASDYLIKIVETSGRCIASTISGNDLMTFEVEKNVWYTVTIIITETKSVIYFDQSYLGSSKTTLSEYKMGKDLFAFNNAAGDNQYVYYIDDISVSTVGDDAFVRLAAYQKTKIENSRYNVRFVSAVGNIFESEESIGFEIISSTNQKEWNLSSKEVYTSISVNYGLNTTSAKELGGKYLTMATILSVPVGLNEVEFKILPYVIVVGIKVYSSSVTITINPPTEKV